MRTAKRTSGTEEFTKLNAAKSQTVPGRTRQRKELIRKVMDRVSGNWVLKESRRSQGQKAGHDGVSTFALGGGLGCGDVEVVERIIVGVRCCAW